jgi:hypothetical protein
MKPFFEVQLAILRLEHLKVTIVAI